MMIDTLAAGTGDTVEATPQSGIVWVYHFQPDGTAELIPSEAAERALASTTGWTWIHLGLADARCRAWVAQHQPLSEIARDTLLGSDDHLRLDVLGREIVGVLPDLHQELVQETDALVRLRFVLTERALISARRKPVHSVEINRRAIAAGRRFPTAISLLDSIIDHFADTISHLAERLGSEIDTVEEQVMHDEATDQRQRLGQIRLQAARVHRHLAQLRGMFHRIEPRVATRDAAIAQAIRALAQKLDAIDHDVGSLAERARLLIEEMGAKTAEITNRRLFIISVLTAFLLPPTLITGFFGMNTKDLPLQNIDGGTWWALGIALVATALSYWALRRVRAF
jgi:zinc transporter